MRVVQHQQMSIGEIDVSNITFDARSRDDIPKILRGLQHIYTDLALREAVFARLTKQIAPKADKSNSRPGMTRWAILVCGVVRLDMNIDYDRLHALVQVALKAQLELVALAKKGKLSQDARAKSQRLNLSKQDVRIRL